MLDVNVAGQGRTIVIIDDYQSPTIGADLQIFDRLFGLSDPSLHIFTPFGVHPYDPTNPANVAFALEISLDVEWAHALAPDATIDLVLGNPADNSVQGQLNALIDATQYAVERNLGDVISLSVGLGETCYNPDELRRWHTAFTLARDRQTTVLAASGDSGSAVTICDRPNHPVAEGQGVNYPGSDPLVSSVGGTTLQASRQGVYQSETTWNGSLMGEGSTGGGFSELFPRPAYQDGISGIGQLRATPDVAYDGDPTTGFPVVSSSYMAGGSVLLPVGGTSAGTPQWAAIIALADQATQQRLGFLNGAFYRLSQNSLYKRGFHDVTVGNNAYSYRDVRAQLVTIPGFDAATGWDAATGVGSPNAATLAPLLAKYRVPTDGDGL
jgi:subtilase family serine protease